MMTLEPHRPWRRLLIDEHGPSVELFDPIHQVLLCRYPGYEVTAGAWSPDSQQVALGSSYRTVRVWQGSDGTLAAEHKGQPEPHQGLCRVTQLIWSPDGARLAFACSDGAITLWNPRLRGRGQTSHEHHAQILALAWSPDSLWLAAASSDGVLTVWDVRQEQVLARWCCPLQVHALRWKQGFLAVYHRDMLVQRIGKGMLPWLQQTERGV